jgi:hypothetical protein
MVHIIDLSRSIEGSSINEVTQLKKRGLVIKYGLVNMK